MYFAEPTSTPTVAPNVLLLKICTCCAGLYNDTAHYFSVFIRNFAFKCSSLAKINNIHFLTKKAIIFRKLLNLCAYCWDFVSFYWKRKNFNEYILVFVR